MKGFSLGLCTLELYIPQSHSLKEKRQVLRSIKSKIKNKFNVVIAEVDALDRWQYAVLGVTTLSNDQTMVNSILDQVFTQISACPDAEIIKHRLEFF